MVTRMSLLPRDFHDYIQDSFFNDFSIPLFTHLPSRLRGESVPPMNLVEKEDGLYATLELPGMKSEDINLELDNNMLKIQGQKYIEEKEQNNKYRYYERRSGSFSRSFTVYPNTRHEDISATLKDGLLSIRVAKNNRKDEKRTITIKSD